MKTFHIDGEGDAGECRAKQGKCPFGSDINHYASLEDARNAYELSMASERTQNILSKHNERQKVLDDKSSYDELKATATAIVSFKGKNDRELIKEFKNVKLDDPIAIKFKDGSVFLGKASDGLDQDMKRGRMSKILAPGVYQFGALSLKGVPHIVHVDEMEEALVLDKSLSPTSKLDKNEFSKVEEENSPKPRIYENEHYTFLTASKGKAKNHHLQAIINATLPKDSAS